MVILDEGVNVEIDVSSGVSVGFGVVDGSRRGVYIGEDVKVACGVRVGNEIVDVSFGTNSHAVNKKLANRKRIGYRFIDS